MATAAAGGGASGNSITAGFFAVDVKTDCPHLKVSSTPLILENELAV